MVKINETTCKQCGLCCHKFSITLTLKDIEQEPRLRDKIMPVQNVGNPKTRRYMIEKGHPFVIRKTHRGAPCPFLSADNLCLIYDTRPQICRDYPQGTKCIKEIECHQLQV